MKPLISLVIPFYNRQAFLPDTLASLVRQDYRPLQIILVDNASTDNSLNIVQNFKKDFENADFHIIIHHESCVGAAPARNCGLDACQGEYTYFFDSDDEISSDFLSVCQAEASASNLDLVAAPTVMLFPNGRTRIRDYALTQNPADQILTGMLSTQSMFFRTSFIRSLRWNPQVPLWNDWELGIRVLLAQPKMKWLRQPFHLIRQHSHSISGQPLSQAREKIQTALFYAFHDINQVPLPSLRRRYITALACRLAIIEGQLKRQGLLGFPSLRRQLASHAPRLCPSRLLRFYVSHGGRGAWIIARYLCKIS